MRRSFILFFLVFPFYAWTISITIPSSLTQEKKIEPLQIQEGIIPIQNLEDTPVLVKVTLSDYSFNAKGESFFPEAGSNKRSNSSWITVGDTQIQIPAKSTYQFAYTLKVPDDPSLEGSYWSIFLIEAVQKPQEILDKKQSLGVQTVIRYGVQIISHVEQKGTYELKILDKKLVNKTLSLDVENSGSWMQNPCLLIELVDLQGKKIGKFEAQKQRIFPDCSVNYQVDLSSIASGKYKALVLLDHGQSSLFGAKYDIDLE